MAPNGNEIQSRSITSEHRSKGGNQPWTRDVNRVLLVVFGHDEQFPGLNRGQGGYTLADRMGPKLDVRVNLEDGSWPRCH